VKHVVVYSTDGWERVFVDHECVYDGHGLETGRPEFEAFLAALGATLTRVEIDDPDTFYDKVPR
jgi:hypothetical protein